MAKEVVAVALLRGVNVTGNNLISMAALKQVCIDLACSRAETYIQSGNVVVQIPARRVSTFATRLEERIEEQFGFRTTVVLRTAEELRRIIAANPFQEQAEPTPAYLVVSFLYGDPGEERRATARSMPFAGEALHFAGREIYIHYVNGQGQSKLRWPAIDKALGVTGTARNWNTVRKLLAMAEAMEAE